MRSHSNNYKTKISTPGKMLNNKITYIVNNETKILNDNDLFGVSLNTETNLFKTVMKELEFQTKNAIPKNTLINFQNGVKLQGDVDYEYIDFGNFIVNSYEWIAEENNFNQIAYDSMLKTMIDYDNTNITYPITIREYINIIATKCGLVFANSNDEFVNYNRIIEHEYFENGEYTFRDVLDYLCELIGGWLIINENDEIQVKYPSETNETFSKDFLNNINVSFEKKYGPINSVVLSRTLNTDNIVKQDENSILINGLNEIRIADNPFLEDVDRDDYINEIFNKINGLEFYIMDVSSTGILFLETGDLFNFNVGNNSYSIKSGVIKSGISKMIKNQSGNYKCLYMNSRIAFTQGVEENIFTEEPQTAELDYKLSSPSDKAIKDAIIMTNKNAGEIVLKATSDGKLVQVALKGDANNEGSAFIVDADNISLTGKTINLTSDDISIDSQYFKLYSSGVVEMNDARDKLQQFITMYYGKDTNVEKKATYTPTGIILKDKTLYDNYGYDPNYSYIQMNAGSGLTPRFVVSCVGSSTNDNGTIFITHKQIHMVKYDYISQVLTTTDILPTGITTPEVIQTSLETDKKNFEIFKNGIDTIKNIDIYTYHLKTQKDDEKKHIGFVIGDNYNYSKKVTSNDNKGVDVYSFISVCCQAIKEQQEQIEILQNEINLLKERIEK